MGMPKLEQMTGEDYISERFHQELSTVLSLANGQTEPLTSEIGDLIDHPPVPLSGKIKWDYARGTDGQIKVHEDGAYTVVYYSLK